MKWDALEEEPCSLARTVAVIGDRWSLLILRECFLRKRRFEAFQSALAITRHLLAERLKKLVRLGVLRRIPYQESPKRYEYILTQKGPRPLPGYHVDRSLGRYPHGRRARPAASARAQELRENFRPGDGLLRMRRTAACTGSSCPRWPRCGSRSGRAGSRKPLKQVQIARSGRLTPAGEARLQQQRIKRTFGADSVPQNDAVIPSFALSRLSRRPAPQRTRCRPASTTSRSCHPEKRK